MNAPASRAGRVLFGFMTEQDAMTFLHGMCVVENEDEVKVFREKWRKASDAVREISTRAGWSVDIRELSSQFLGYVKQVSSQPMFRQLFGTGSNVREVEINSIIAFQRHIDTEYTLELASKMRGNPQLLLETCLPTEFRQNVDITFDPAVAGATFSSFSPKLIVQGVHLSGLAGGPDITIAEQPAQPGVLVQTGSQPNYVQVVKYQNRYFLKNGYHRTYAAMIAGHKYVPAVLIAVDSFADTGAQQQGFFPKEVLMSDTPPVMRDFLLDEITTEVRLRRMRKVIRVRADEFLVPG